MGQAPGIGHHLRSWRQRRRMSQLDLACEADISTRHVSFLETGRSRPSRDMVLHLAERLDVPLRERNVLLVAAGFAPVFPERPLDDPMLATARAAVDLVLAAHEPYPALAVDRHWTLIAANKASARVMGGISPELSKPPVNVLRIALHPEGLARRTANFAEWRGDLLARLRRQVDMTGDPTLAALYDELAAYPAPHPTSPPPMPNPNAVAIPFRLLTDSGVLSFLSTITVFGTPVDVTVSEVAIETFLPADRETAEALRRMAAG
ncbi:MAG TPA: helix-turn-helix transcriptional regulator [Stellaceae bacterium]|nr:helix-turn-helix transcriptional regulator [Stellaceae bacterium]